MKLALLTLSFILFASSVAFSNDFEQVSDVHGNPIFPSSKHYIMLPIVGLLGGGVSLGYTSNSRCPITILQDYFEVFKGTIVKFSIPRASTGEIFTGTPLDIEFTKKPDCVESSKWVVFVGNDIQKACVGISGPQDHPGQQILSGTFNIQKYKLGYKLVFCVTGLPTCLDIGVYDNRDPDEHGRQLALIEYEALDLVFIFASSNSGFRTIV